MTMKRIIGIFALIMAIFLSMMIPGCASNTTPLTSGGGSTVSSASATSTGTTSGTTAISGGTTAVLAATAAKPSNGTNPVSFVDPVFEKLLKAELKKESIFPADLEPYTNLKIGGDHFLILAGKDVPEKSIVLLFGTDVELEGKRYTGFGTIKSLADLAHFPNVTTLHVTLQPELDYSTIPAEFKKRLRSAHFTQSKIKDIGFLNGIQAPFNLTLSCQRW